MIKSSCGYVMLSLPRKRVLSTAGVVIVVVYLTCKQGALMLSLISTDSESYPPQRPPQAEAEEDARQTFNAESSRFKTSQSPLHSLPLLTVDILSIGSIRRLDYLEAQKATFGSHVVVRHFFNATEVNDADPECSNRLTAWDAAQISKWCKVPGRWDPQNQFVMEYWQGPFAKAAWLAKKPNPAGWMCAQTRPAQAFHKVVQHYRTNQQLPDYLIIMDDDTYFNMDLFQDYFQQQANTEHHSTDDMSLYANSSIPMAIAGCLIRSPVNDIHLTIPFGGYGLILSKGYLDRVMAPIHCQHDKELCHVIQDISPLKEGSVFSEGMSISDLIYAYAINQPYVQYRNWTVGFCLHSDWLWGIVANFYKTSRHNARKAESFKDVPQERMEAYFGSELYAGNPKQGGRGNCDSMLKYCHSLSPACHYSNPERMHQLARITRSRNPHRYRNPSPATKLDPTDSSPIGIDILSFGSNARPLHHDAQLRTIATHKGVRKFIAVAEGVDLDSNCTGLNDENFTSISNWCQTRIGEDYQLLMLMRRFTAETMCQQGRIMTNLMEQITSYSKPQGEFPEYLLLILDTTYINIEAYYGELQYHQSQNATGEATMMTPSKPWAMTGCKRRIPGGPFPIPTLDYGLVLSRKTMQILANPIHCDQQHANDGINGSVVCDRIHINKYKEKEFFRDGMSLIQLLYEMVTAEPMSKYKSWVRGNCFRSDWLLGLALEHYNIVLEAYANSRHIGIKQKESKKKLCANVGALCRAESMYCANVSPDLQLAYARRLRQLSPASFND